MDPATASPGANAVERIYWFRSPMAWRLIALRYLPLLGAFNLVWETAQLPLYTIWQDGSVQELAYAVTHCTLGDLGIGGFSLMAALTVTRSSVPSTWSLIKVAGLTTAFAVSYTVYSEWLNTSVWEAWAYSDLMPVVPVIGIGLSPLLQWLVIPTLALALSSQRYGKSERVRT